MILAEFSLLKYAKLISRVFVWLFAVAFLGVVVRYYSKEIFNYTNINVSIINGKLSEGFAWIFFSLSELFLLIDKFVEQKLKKPKTSFLPKTAITDYEKYNLAEILSFEAARAARKCEKHRKGQITSSLFFYYILEDNPKIDFIFSRLILDSQDIKQVIEKDINFSQNQTKQEKFSRDFEMVVIEALKIADEKNHKKIELGDIISALSLQNKTFREILIKYDIKQDDVKNMVWLQETIEEKAEKRKRFWDYDNLSQGGALVKDWASAYTVNLDNFSTDLTKTINENITTVLAKKPEIELMERALARPEVNNILLVGDPGKGKKSMVYSLADKIRKGLSLSEVNYRRVIELNLQAIFAQTTNIEEVEKKLDDIFKEVVFAGNIILVINDFHNYIGKVQGAGIVDISGIIIPYLQLPNFKFIAITTNEGLSRYISKNPSILSLFEKIEVEGITDKETLLILENMIPLYEKRYKIFVSYPALREIISLTDRYMASLPFPDKAIDVFNEAITYVAKLGKEKVVLPFHIDKIVTEKTQIPVGEIAENEKETLLNLEKLIHQRIINQEEAVKEVSMALRRARADITVRKGPMGAFLFMGPTGVGKTETSKALAEIYFKAESRMIRLDMSEFQQLTDISRLLGSEQELGLLTEKVRQNPFSLVLLDEFEKGHPNILNLFLQVFDEGFITDGLGRKVDFKSAILIATSNAGYQIILEALKQKTPWKDVKEKILDFLFKEGRFRPELINRFDAVVVFKPLTKENLLQIAELLLLKLNKNLSQKSIELVITEKLKEKIVELGYNPVFGAREMRRVIQDKVENVLAEALLSGKLSRGSKIEVDPNSFKLIISHQ